MPPFRQWYVSLRFLRKHEKPRKFFCPTSGVHINTDTIHALGSHIISLILPFRFGSQYKDTQSGEFSLPAVALSVFPQNSASCSWIDKVRIKNEASKEKRRLRAVFLRKVQAVVFKLFLVSLTLQRSLSQNRTPAIYSLHYDS